MTVPGHVIEGMWFQRLVLPGPHNVHVPRVWRTARRHVGLGWDDAQGGGLLLWRLIVTVNRWAHAASKLWWPHTEALVAAAWAAADTGETYWYNDYGRLWRFCLRHYVDWEHGEWRQKLNRDLTLFTGTIALPVKDPFYLPRSLILQIERWEQKKTPPLVAGLGA